jgi:hypothetical protein
MRRTLLITGILLVCLCFAISPAQAFTAKSLDITVQPTGDATITFDYDLSWFENAAVFMRITDPALELQKALESNYHKPVTVTAADSGHAQFIVQGFASRNENNGAVTMTTPAVSFAEAQNVLNTYWFAPLISPDFSPNVTHVSFPDGYVETFNDQISIPAVKHTLGA